MQFRRFFEMTALRDKLLDIPQDPSHHPEGNVFTHTRMVRYALPTAVDIIRSAASDPNSSLSNLNFNLTNDEINLLKAAAWMHDIGKAGATTLNIDGGHFAYNPSIMPFKDWGRWQAIGHEKPKYFKSQMRNLAGTTWENMWNKMSPSDKVDLFFIIKHHMGLRFGEGVGFGKRLSKSFVDNDGKYKNTRRIKLLLVFLLMDRLGRAVADPQGDAVNAIEQLEMGAKSAKRRINHPQSQPSSDNPITFLQSLSHKPDDVIRRAFIGKFGREPTADEILGKF